jgi:DNA repair protein RecO (recombination protein O)
MTTKYKTRAFVFKKNDVNESDRVFSVFTEDFGRLDIHAKAIRKTVSKLRSGVDIFFLSEIEFIQGKNRKTLTDAVKIKKFENITGDLQKLKIVYQIADILDNFIKGQEKDKETFDLLIETFDKLEDGLLKIKNHQLAYQYFLWSFISFQGYKSEVDNCAVCRQKLNPYNIYFSSKEGGIVCKKCSDLDKESKKINSDVVKILRLIFKKDWDTISKLKIEPASQKLLNDISENVIIYIK